jgi:hypothetical protein
MALNFSFFFVAETGLLTQRKSTSLKDFLEEEPSFQDFPRRRTSRRKTQQMKKSV